MTFQAFAAASVLIGLASIHGPSVIGAAVHGPKHDDLETAFLAAAVAVAVAAWKAGHDSRGGQMQRS